MLKKIIAFILIFLSGFFLIHSYGHTEKNNFSSNAAGDDDISVKQVYLNVFERKDCVHCINQFEFLDSLKNKDFYVNKIDIAIPENEAKFKAIVEKYNLSASTPLNLVGSSIIVGFDAPENSGKQLLEKIAQAKQEQKFNWDIDHYLQSNEKKNLEQGGKACDDNPAEGCALPENDEIKVEKKEAISLFGYNISIKDMSLFSLSALLGFIDGFNPCAMWVLLTFLIALSQIGNRRKMALVAGIFIIAQAVMYYLILVFWSSAWKIMPNKDLVSLFIGLFAIGAGLFFLYKWYVNRKKFTCDVASAEQQNKVTEKINKLSSGPTTFLTIFSILAIAFSVNVIEVACSLGIPQTFTATLAVNSLTFWGEQFYILVYTIFYMIDDLVVFGLALWGYQKFYKIGTKYSKVSTLIAGIVILALGIMLAFFPTFLIF